jgi:hypothetical protein
MIGKTIKSILTGNSSLVALVGTKIFPYVMNESTTMPAVVYTIDSMEPEYTKGGWVNDSVTFTVNSFAKDYTGLQSVVSAVRTALELNHTGSGTQSINRIYLIGFNEGYDGQSDVFFNSLIFNVIINTY